MFCDCRYLCECVYRVCTVIFHLHRALEEMALHSNAYKYYMLIYSEYKHSKFKTKTLMTNILYKILSSNNWWNNCLFQSPVTLKTVMSVNSTNCALSNKVSSTRNNYCWFLSSTINVHISNMAYSLIKPGSEIFI